MVAPTGAGRWQWYEFIGFWLFFEDRATGFLERQHVCDRGLKNNSSVLELSTWAIGVAIHYGSEIGVRVKESSLDLLT